MSTETTTTGAVPVAAAARGVPRSLVVAAGAVPVMVVGQFAFLAAVPVAVLLVGAFRRTRLRSLRWSAALLAAVYAVPFAIWLLRPDAAQSLSKDIHPGFVAAIVPASALVLVTLLVERRRSLTR